MLIPTSVLPLRAARLLNICRTMDNTREILLQVHVEVTMVNGVKVTTFVTTDTSRLCRVVVQDRSLINVVAGNYTPASTPKCKGWELMPYIGDKTYPKWTGVVPTVELRTIGLLRPSCDYVGGYLINTDEGTTLNCNTKYLDDFSVSETELLIQQQAADGDSKRELQPYVLTGTIEHCDVMCLLMPTLRKKNAR
jgi:hypothetical protein